MCVRFTLKLSPELAAAIYAVQNGVGMASYNIAPTQEVPVVVQRGNERAMQMQHFGFVPFYAKDPKEGVRSINARVETISEKPAFKKALHDQRKACL